MRMLTILVIVLLPSAVRAEPPKPSAKLKELFGERTTGLLAGATKVEVFRVESGKPGESDKTIAGFRITGKGKDQDEKFAAKVATVLLDEESYILDAAKACIFQPGVSFRVWKGEESVAVVICFSCDQVRLVPLDKNGKAGKVVGAESDPGRAALVKLVKAAFPDDKEIQKLKESR